MAGSQAEQAFPAATPVLALQGIRDLARSDQQHNTPQLDLHPNSDSEKEEVKLEDSTGTKRTEITDAHDESTPAKPGTNAAADPPSEHPQDTGPPYSVFTTNQKRGIIIIGSLASFFSPLSSQIYFPALNTIAADLNVSVARISLTVTTYLIVQGLAPTLIANFSDNAGRRPAYLICFTIYAIANLGLGLQNSYAALAVLRCVQSGGSSGTVALANGLAGDIVTSAERGQYIAYSLLGGMLGPSISPVIGGLISEYVDWHWIFWFLLILGGAFGLVLFTFLPETCRNVVGDGSGEKPWWNWNLLDLMRESKKKEGRKNTQELDSEQGLEDTKGVALVLPAKKKFSFGNPLNTLVVALDFETFVFLMAVALGCFGFYALSTAAALQFRDGYNFSDSQIALMFLPLGIGSIVSALIVGRAVDWNYARHARRHGLPMTKNRRVELSEFPIEIARMEVAAPLFVLSVVVLVAYGWVMQVTPHIAIPIVVMFFAGVTLTGFFQVVGVLLVDLHPTQPATVSSANNLLRCELGAVASAVVIPAIHGIGSGWTFTIFALALAAWGVVAWFVAGRGIELRKKRREKEERRVKRKQDRRMIAC